MARLCTFRFCPLTAQWRHVASTTFALRPRLYRVRTKEITKEKKEVRVWRRKESTKERTPNTAPRLCHSCGRHEVWRGGTLVVPSHPTPQRLLAAAPSTTAPQALWKGSLSFSWIARDSIHLTYSAAL